MTGTAPTAPTTGTTTDRSTNGVRMMVIGLAIALGAVVFALTDDFVIGLAAGAVCYAVVSRIERARADADR